MRLVIMIVSLFLSHPSFAQELTKADVERALLEHHKKFSGECIAFFDSRTGSFLSGDNNALKYLLQTEHVNRIGQAFIVNEKGKQYLHKSITNWTRDSFSPPILGYSMFDGSADCFAIGKTTLKDISVFSRAVGVHGEYEFHATYSVVLTNLPDWLKQIKTEPVQISGADINWYIDREKATPGSPLIINGKRGIIIRANNMWMTDYTYSRLRSGLR